MQNFLKCWLTGALVSTSCWAQTDIAASSAYPNRAVRLIVGFPAGTGPDIVARQLSQQLSDTWGVGVVVDNKPGAGGLIAATQAARSAADGHTLMLGETGQLAIAPNSYSQLPYNVQTDFVAVSQVATIDFAFLVNPTKVEGRNMKDFAQWLTTSPLQPNTQTQSQSQSKPQRLLVATFGAGTPGHFGAFLLGQALKVELESVHYKSAGEALAGVLSGDVQGVFASTALAAPQVKAGKLVALATTGALGSAALPGVATFKDQGMPNMTFNAWFGVVAPRQTAPSVVAKISADIVKAIHLADTKAKLEQAGFRVTGTSPEAFERIISADTANWGKAVAATGFRAD